MDNQDSINVNYIERNDNTIILIDGLDANRKKCLLGIDVDKQLIKIARRGENVAIEQFYHIVLPDLKNAEFLFKGLRRPLMQRENKKADSIKVVYIWSAKKDYTHVGYMGNEIQEHNAPESHVFFVTATLNEDLKYREAYPEIYAWVEHWSWVDENLCDAGHPIDWKTRYEEKLW